MKTKRIFAILFLLLFLVTFITPATHSASASTFPEPRVYITTYGDCYHSSSCQYLYKSKKAIGLYKAKDLGYYACSVCGGKSDSYILVEYYANTSSSKKSSSLDTWEIIGLCALGACGCIFVVEVIIEIFKKKKK